MTSLVALLSLICVLEALSLRYFPSISQVKASGHRTGRMIALRGASGQYDPFQSDPALSGAVNKEMNVIKSLSSVMIKTELAEYKVSSASIMDRRDLEYTLAVARVKRALKAKEEKVLRSKKAMQIADEVEVVSDLTDAEIIDELHSRGTTFTKSDSRDRLVGRLATARIEGITYQDEASTKLKQGMDDLGRILGEAAGDGSTDVKKSSWDSSAARDVGEAAVRKVSTFAKARISTPAELAASEYLQSSEGIEFSEENELSPEDISVCLQALRGMTSFDHVTEWAQNKPRASLVQILEARKEKIPTYAPKSSLVRLLADSVMFERNLHKDRGATNAEVRYLKEDRFLDKTRTTTPRTSHTVTSIQGGRHTGPAGGGGGASSEQGGNTEGSHADEGLDMFSFEKDLASGLGEKLQESTGRVLDGLTDFMSGESTQAALRSAREFGRETLVGSGVSSAVGDAVKAGADAGTSASVSLATWAGRGLLTPRQTLFATTAYCILRRRGILTWLGTLVLLRLYRFVLQIDRQERDWEEQILAEREQVGQVGGDESGAEGGAIVDARLE